MMGLVLDQTGALPASDEPIRMLLAPRHVTTRREVLERPSPVPAGPGVYGWYFDVPPAGVPVAGTHRTEFGHLLYVGISPGEPPRNGKPPSQQNLRKRIRYHFRGNAAGSTLRLTLGSLLATELGIELRRVGSGNRLTFSDGEAVLSEWMGEHARVCWFVDPKPWIIETRIIAELVLPLNLDQNKRSGFHAALSAARAESAPGCADPSDPATVVPKAVTRDCLTRRPGRVQISLARDVDATSLWCGPAAKSVQ